MIGTRIFPHKFGGLLLLEGGFGRDLRGRWWARPPGENSRVLQQEHVVEHADGMITYRARINGGTQCFNLYCGVWSEVKGGLQ